MGYQRHSRVSETPAAIHVPLRLNGLLAFIFRNVRNVCASMITYSDLMFCVLYTRVPVFVLVYYWELELISHKLTL